MTNHTMKALTFSRYSKVPEYAFMDVPVTTLQPNELLVKVHAAGINPIDNMIPTGIFKAVLHFQLPATVGSDLAGEIVAVGEKVTAFKPGDFIFASVFDLGIGSLAEYAAIPEHTASLKPSNLDFVQAASVPMVALTSWQALKERADIQPGQKVFIPAGSGGIGTFAIQLAKHFGAYVGTTTSSKNIELVRSLGADTVVDYKKEAFEATLKDYDLALGTVRGDTIEKSVSILKRGGKLVSLVGPLDEAFAHKRKLNFIFKFLFKLMSRKLRKLSAQGNISYSFLFVRPAGNILSEIAQLLENKTITPVVDQVFPFEQSKEALAYLAKGHAKGKVVIKIR